MPKETLQPIASYDQVFYDAALSYMQLANDVPGGAEVIDSGQGYELDTTNPAVLMGTARALIEAGVPDAGDALDPTITCRLEILASLTTPEATSAMEEANLVACARLFQTVEAMLSVNTEDGYVAYNQEFGTSDAFEQAKQQDIPMLTSQSLVELVAHGGAVNSLTTFGSRLAHKHYSPQHYEGQIPPLSDDILRQAAESIVANSSTPSELTQALNELTGVSLQGGNRSAQAKMLAETLQLPEQDLQIYLDSYYATTPQAKSYLGIRGEYVHQTPEGQTSFDIERMMRSQANGVDLRARNILGHGGDTADQQQEHIEAFVGSSLILLDRVSDFPPKLEVQRLVLDVAAEYLVDESQLYDIIALGSVAFKDPHTRMEKEEALTGRQVAIPELGQPKTESQLLGMLAGLTSKTRRHLLKGNADAIAQEAAVIERLQHELVARNPILQEALNIRLADHFSVLGGSYLSRAEQVIGNVTTDATRAALAKSLELARALEDTEVLELAALQAAELTKDSQSAEYPMTAEQELLAERLRKKVAQEEAVLRLRVSDPKALMSILFGEKRVKSMWETMRTNGVNGGTITDSGDWGRPSYLGNRINAERVMGLADHVEHPDLLEPPISTFVKATIQVPVSAIGYGFIEIGLKNDTVRDRTVFVNGDSANEAMDGSVSFMSWDDAMQTATDKAVLVRDKVIEPPMNTPSPPKGWDYVEGLVLGGVTSEDVATVVIHARSFISEEEAMKLKDVIESNSSGINVVVDRRS